MIPLLIAIVFAVLFLIVYVRTGDARRRRRIRRRIYDTPSHPRRSSLTRSQSFIYYKEFEKKWIISDGRKNREKSETREKSGRPNGFKYQDGSGCYVVTIYDSPVRDGRWGRYKDIYIGQSVHVCQRVHNHFNGKGNGYIYEDIQQGKYVYVHFIMCQRSEMNDMEKELIQAFDATRSYNQTRGGGAKR